MKRIIVVVACLFSLPSLAIPAVVFKGLVGGSALLGVGSFAAASRVGYYANPDKHVCQGLFFTGASAATYIALRGRTPAGLLYTVSRQLAEVNKHPLVGRSFQTTKESNEFAFTHYAEYQKPFARMGTDLVLTKDKLGTMRSSLDQAVKDRAKDAWFTGPCSQFNAEHQALSQAVETSITNVNTVLVRSRQNTTCLNVNCNPTTCGCPFGTGRQANPANCSAQQVFDGLKV